MTTKDIGCSRTKAAKLGLVQIAVCKFAPACTPWRNQPPLVRPLSLCSGEQLTQATLLRSTPRRPEGVRQGVTLPTNENKRQDQVML